MKHLLRFQSILGFDDFPLINVCLHWLPAIGGQLRVGETIGLLDTEDCWSNGLTMGTPKWPVFTGKLMMNGTEWDTQIEDAQPS